LEKWKKGQRHLEQFWKLWKRDYLLSLRERLQNRIRQPRSCSSLTPHIGDVVLVHDNGPRGSWKLARVSALVEGTDGQIRTAKITFPSGSTTSRSLAHLYPLECEHDFNLNSQNSNPDESSQILQTEPKSSRLASDEAPRQSMRQFGLQSSDEED